MEGWRKQVRGGVAKEAKQVTEVKRSSCPFRRSGKVFISEWR